MPESKKRTLPSPLFLLSLDTELAWGGFDKGGVERYGELYGGVREGVDNLLTLFQKYQIHATWAVVGHLFLESCSREGPDNHNHVLQPEYRWYPEGWLSHDPYTDVERDPFFYAPDIVENIRACKVEQEIASHTFTHAILGDPECTAEVARSQIEAGIQAAGGAVRSLVFPRNSIGHLDVAAACGIRAYRGNGDFWYGKRGPVARAGHFLDQFLAIRSPVYSSIETAGEPPLYNFPASMFFPPRGGKWRGVPLGARVRKARRGIEAAIEKCAMFHLWFHPFNLSGSSELLDALEAILSTVADHAKQGRIRSTTMGEAVDILDEENRR